MRRAQFLDGEQKRSLELLLGLLIKFRAPNSEIKDVDCNLSFGVDQSNLNVAIVNRQSGCDLAQQAGAILSHYLQQGAVRGGSVIEIQPGRYPDHDGTTQRLAAQQHFDRCLQRDHIQEARAEAVHFRRVELKSAKRIGELKGVDNNSGVIGKRFCLDDVHAPGRKSSGHVRKQQRPVARDDRKLPKLPQAAQVDLHGGLRKLQGHLKVIADLLRHACLRVALRKTFQEAAQFLCALGSKGENAFQQGRVYIGTIALLVYTAVHEVRGGDIELPQDVCLPWCQRVGIDRFDVRVGHQAQHFQMGLRRYLFSKCTDRYGVENVAP